MAVAAAWTHRHDPDAINVFVASDHHIVDHAAFQTAVSTAAKSAAAGRIVTLGISPREASSAYGYIWPQGRGLSEVVQFVEKPDRTEAAAYIDAGYLWNSGNFVVAASTLLSELRDHAPDVEAAAQAALPPVGRNIGILNDAFAKAPKISIDYALMEKTRLASVLEVDFDWSDLGAWDAIAATGEGGIGLSILEDAEGCLTRASDGMVVAAIGVRNLAIIAESDAVLVCDLSRSQDVKKVVERLKISAPQHVDFSPTKQESLVAGGLRFAKWLRLKALPVWSSLGQSSQGAFVESIALDGRAVFTSRRARVQARQIYVYAKAGIHGWEGAWRRTVETGLDRLVEDYLRSDGLCRTLLTADGVPLDETAMIYDQAFVLLALATAKQASIGGGDVQARAEALRDDLLTNRLSSGAFVEEGSAPYQSNCHMHLLEASLAWEEAGGDEHWKDLTDSLVKLALTSFIDQPGGFLREFFNDKWLPADGEDGQLVEPGHQFEWAWLLVKYGLRRNDDEAVDMARRLYKFGRRGINDRMSVAVDAMNSSGAIRSNRARLWPQTEWLKASLILSTVTHDIERQEYIDDAAAAQRAVWLYLTEDGLWHDKRLPNRSFLEEPAPASSFYHIMAAFDQLVSRAGNISPLSSLGLK